MTPVKAIRLGVGFKKTIYIRATLRFNPSGRKMFSIIKLRAIQMIKFGKENTPLIGQLNCSDGAFGATV